MATEVQEALAAWRQAIAEAEAEPEATERRSSLEDQAERCRQRYLAAILSARGRVDQLEALAEDAQRRLARSRELLAPGTERSGD